jgi:hypothetical protein
VARRAARRSGAHAAWRDGTLRPARRVDAPVRSGSRTAARSRC